MNSLASSKTMVRVSNLSKTYNGLTILNGVSFEIHEGEVVAIIGASGCGKSTLLRVISGLEEPDTGEIEIEDPNFTLVFQYSALFDSLTVFENVAFSLLEEPDLQVSHQLYRHQSYSEEELREMVKEKLRLVGLEGIEDKYPNELSGGMQKRVSFARAIMSNPKIIFYDEPTAGLDPIASTALENYILKLRDELNAASIVVTHQFSTIYRTADRVCLLKNGQICWQGKPEELLQSEDPYVRQFAFAGTKGLIS